MAVRLLQEQVQELKMALEKAGVKVLTLTPNHDPTPRFLDLYPRAKFLLIKSSNPVHELQAPKLAQTCYDSGGAVQNKIGALESKNAALQDELKALKTKGTEEGGNTVDGSTNSAGKVRQLSLDIESLKKDLKNCIWERESYKSERDEFALKLEKAEKESTCKGREHELRNVSNERLMIEISELRELHASVRNERDDLKLERGGWISAADQHKVEKEELKNEKEDWKRESDLWKRERDELKSERDEVKAELRTAIKERDSIRDASTTDSNLAIETQMKERELLNQEVREARSELSTMSQREEAMGRELELNKTELELALDEISRVEDLNVDISQELTRLKVDAEEGVRASIRIAIAREEARFKKIIAEKEALVFAADARVDGLMMEAREREARLITQHEREKQQLIEAAFSPSPERSSTSPADGEFTSHRALTSTTSFKMRGLSEISYQKVLSLPPGSPASSILSFGGADAMAVYLDSRPKSANRLVKETPMLSVFREQERTPQLGHAAATATRIRVSPGHQ